MNQNSNLKELNLCVLENSRANLIKSFFFLKKKVGVGKEEKTMKER